MEQTHYRPDHGQEHSGKYAAYVRVSTDKQDVKTQEFRIKNYLNGGDYQVKWFRDEGVSSGKDWHKREALQLCLDYCRKNEATLIIYSISRMARRTWEALRFLEQEVLPGKIKLVVVDNPNLDHKTVGLLAAVAEMERANIRERTKASIDRIQAEIKEKGYFVSKAGKRLTSLGSRQMNAISKKGTETVIDATNERTQEVGPLIAKYRKDNISYRDIAAHLNRLSIPTPTKLRNPDTTVKNIWHASSVRNYYLRYEGDK
tara:strand:+ start:842 stop:1618 length:777 start_codon:yes stop_codon:yes gene_type:complete